jgi:hypothetical protein
MVMECEQPLSTVLRRRWCRVGPRTYDSSLSTKATFKITRLIVLASEWSATQAVMQLG